MALPTQEYEFVKIEFSADRNFKPSADPGVTRVNPIDLRKLTQELNIFEDVMKGYITAKLVIIDDAAIFSEVMEMQGTEKLKIEVKGYGRQSGQSHCPEHESSFHTQSSENTRPIFGVCNQCYL